MSIGDMSSDVQHRWSFVILICTRKREKDCMTMRGKRSPPRSYVAQSVLRGNFTKKRQSKIWWSTFTRNISSGTYSRMKWRNGIVQRWNCKGTKFPPKARLASHTPARPPTQKPMIVFACSREMPRAINILYIHNCYIIVTPAVLNQLVLLQEYFVKWDCPSAERYLRLIFILRLVLNSCWNRRNFPRTLEAAEIWLFGLLFARTHDRRPPWLDAHFYLPFDNMRDNMPVFFIEDSTQINDSILYTPSIVVQQYNCPAAMAPTSNALLLVPSSGDIVIQRTFVSLRLSVASLVARRG